MRRRIFLYNTVAVLLALAALLLISSEVVRRVGAHYAGQAQPEDPPNTAAARELLETWDGAWTELGQRLEGLGYQIQVSLGGTACSRICSSSRAGPGSGRRGRPRSSGTARPWYWASSPANTPWWP